MKRYLADFGLLLVGILWGLGFVFVKIGLNEGIRSVLFVFDKIFAGICGFVFDF